MHFVKEIKRNYLCIAIFRDQELTLCQFLVMEKSTSLLERPSPSAAAY
jgi:hypothetical protein